MELRGCALLLADFGVITNGKAAGSVVCVCCALGRKVCKSFNETWRSPIRGCVRPCDGCGILSCDHFFILGLPQNQIFDVTAGLLSQLFGLKFLKYTKYSRKFQILICEQNSLQPV